MVVSKKTIETILNKTEKILRVDIRYLIKGNFWLNINRFSSVANGLILSVAFANLLTKETYGTYTFVLAVVGLFSMPPTTGLGSGIIKGVARGGYHLMFEGMRKVLPWSILAGTLLAFLGIYYGIMGNITLATSFIIGGIILPISVSFGVSKSFFTSRGDFQTTAKFNLWRTPVMTLLIVTTAIASSSALPIIIVNMFGNIILGLFLYRKMKKMYTAEINLPSGESEKFNDRYAIHSAIISIFGYLSEKMDDFLLWIFVGAAPVAVYNYATAPMQELRALVENQSTLALSKFAQKDFVDVKNNILFRIKQMYFFVVPAIVLYIIIAPLLFKYLFPQYIDAVFFSQLASLSLLSAPRRLMNTAILAHQKIKESYVMNIAPNAIRIILALVFIPKFGILGAIIALLISEVVDYVILGLLMRSTKTITL